MTRLTLASLARVLFSFPFIRARLLSCEMRVNWFRNWDDHPVFRGYLVGEAMEIEISRHILSLHLFLWVSRRNSQLRRSVRYRERDIDVGRLIK